MSLRFYKEITVSMYYSAMRNSVKQKSSFDYPYMGKFFELPNTPPKSPVYHDVKGKYYSSPKAYVEMLTSQSHYIFLYYTVL